MRQYRWIEQVGQRRILLGCWGSFQDPDVCVQLQDYERMGPGDVRYARYRGRGELVTTNLVDINLGIRILLGSSYYEVGVRTVKYS